MKIIDIQNIQYYFNVDRYAKHYIIFFQYNDPIKNARRARRTYLMLIKLVNNQVF